MNALLSATDRENNAFLAAAPGHELADLRRLIGRSLLSRDFGTFGPSGLVALADLEELAAYWCDVYDHRRSESELNAHPQFTLPIQGHPVHFVHERSPRADALPLLLLHAWPGSVFDYVPLLHALTDPESAGEPRAPAFHVVCPSLPGFGFSSCGERAPTLRASASLMDELMQRLGYARYVAHGHGLGPIVARELAVMSAERLSGLHVTLLLALPKSGRDELSALGAREKSQLAGLALAYGELCTTEPWTPRPAALRSRPCALLSSMSSAYSQWAADDPVRGSPLERERLLANVTLTWLSRGTASAAPLFRQARRHAGRSNAVKLGLTRFPCDAPTLRRFVERDHALVHYSEQQRGGHFAALETPRALLLDLRRFAQALDHHEESAGTRFAAWSSKYHVDPGSH